MLELGCKSSTVRSLEDLSSDEEEERSSLPSKRKCRRKTIKIPEEQPKEVKKRPLERKVESEEDEAEEVKRYKPSGSATPSSRGAASPPLKDSPLLSSKDASDETQSDEEEEEKKSPKRLTLPLMSEIVPESPISEVSPKRKDAGEISVENIQHDKMKEKERLNNLLKDL